MLNILLKIAENVYLVSLLSKEVRSCTEIQISKKYQEETKLEANYEF